MEAIEMKGTRANADTEEWDIVGRAPPGWTGPPGREKTGKSKKKVAKLEAALATGTTTGDTSAVADSTVATAPSAANESCDGPSSERISGSTADGDRSARLDLTRCVTTLRALSRLKDAQAFLEPVDYIALELPDYRAFAGCYLPPQKQPEMGSCTRVRTDS
jgi:hypothetical protein